MTTVSNKIGERSALVLATALVALSLGVTGCANTVSGVKQDAATDTQKAATAADQAAAKASATAKQAEATTKAVARNADNEAKELPQDVDSATVVTPMVKASIIRDPVLANTGNLINVNSHDHVTHLVGHVMSADMKTRATEDAQVALAKRHPDYKISNELTVSGGK
jgi:predicted small secreted protein